MECSNCHTKLLATARFCHQCGTKVLETVFRCPSCSGENPVGAKFCLHCGISFVARAPFEEPSTRNADWLPTEAALRDRFLEILERQVIEEQQAEHWPAYTDRLATTDFAQTFDRRIRQLIQILPEHPRSEAEARIQEFLFGLSDFFLIHHCPDLNVVPLPERILRYDQAQPGKVDLYQMCMDYLDFASSPEKIYTDFLNMDLRLLKNASNAFLFPAKAEKILFICDLSLLGSLKEGFAMTDKALYWKAPLQKSQWVNYTDLAEVGPQEDWLQINGRYFHAGRILNIRLMKLLRKLRQWFSN